MITANSTETPATSSVPSKTTPTSLEESENSLWPAELIEQVRSILNTLNQDVTLVTIVNSKNEHSLELKIGWKYYQL